MKRWLAIMLLVLVTGCSSQPATPTATATAVPPTPVPPTPTATPLPPAFSVNGVGVAQAEFDAQLTQIHNAAQTMELTFTPEELKQQVVAVLTDQTLLANAAAAEGYTVTNEAINAKIEELTGAAGGEGKIAEWSAANGYTDASLKLALARSMASAWMRDKIINAVPESMEQIKAQQILVDDLATAEQAKNRLSRGEDFNSVAQRYDPIQAGMLGWFPRGYLTQPAVEEAVFQLNPGEYTEPIQSELGYHIVYVIEREPDRLLDPDARLTLQKAVLNAWLKNARESAVITEP